MEKGSLELIDIEYRLKNLVCFVKIKNRVYAVFWNRLSKKKRSCFVVLRIALRLIGISRIIFDFSSSNRMNDLSTLDCRQVQ